MDAQVKTRSEAAAILDGWCRRPKFRPDNVRRFRPVDGGWFPMGMHCQYRELSGTSERGGG